MHTHKHTGKKELSDVKAAACKLRVCSFEHNGLISEKTCIGLELGIVGTKAKQFTGSFNFILERQRAVRSLQKRFGLKCILTYSRVFLTFLFLYLHGTLIFTEAYNFIVTNSCQPINSISVTHRTPVVQRGPPRYCLQHWMLWPSSAKAAFLLHSSVKYHMKWIETWFSPTLPKSTILRGGAILEVRTLRGKSNGRLFIVLIYSSNRLLWKISFFVALMTLTKSQPSKLF